MLLTVIDLARIALGDPVLAEGGRVRAEIQPGSEWISPWIDGRNMLATVDETITMAKMFLTKYPL